MDSFTIRIKPAIALVNDQSGGNLTGANVVGSQKTFEMHGNKYQLNAGDTLAVPEIVATTWVASDNEVEILPGGFV